MDTPTQSMPETITPAVSWYRRYWYLEALIVVAVVAVAVWLAYRPAVAFSLRAPLNVSVGDELVVTLAQDSDAYTVTAADLKFTYDATKLQLQTVTPGTLLPMAIVPASIGSGRATVTLGSGTSAVPGPGTLAVLTFRVLASGAATIAVDAASQAAASGEDANILPELPPLTVQVR